MMRVSSRRKLFSCETYGHPLCERLYTLCNVCIVLKCTDLTHSQSVQLYLPRRRRVGPSDELGVGYRVCLSLVLVCALVNL